MVRMRSYATSSLRHGAAHENRRTSCSSTCRLTPQPTIADEEPPDRLDKEEARNLVRQALGLGNVASARARGVWSSERTSTPGSVAPGAPMEQPMSSSITATSASCSARLRFASALAWESSSSLNPASLAPVHSHSHRQRLIAAGTYSNQQQVPCMRTSARRCWNTGFRSWHHSSRGPSPSPSPACRLGLLHCPSAALAQ
jgi:hypothetical protein